MIILLFDRHGFENKEHNKNNNNKRKSKVEGARASSKRKA